jgi:hypothetical protein
MPSRLSLFVVAAGLGATLHYPPTPLAENETAPEPVIDTRQLHPDKA